MHTSDTLAKLAPALVAAQAELGGIHKDATNPHFRNRYASLDGIMAVVRPGLAKHGLAVVQGVTSPIETQAGTLHAVAVVTRIVHTSGEWIESRVIVPLAKLDPQGAGAAVTYGRRYALSALLALATEEDDDGESALPPRSGPATARTAPTRSAGAPAPAKPASTPATGEVACPKCGGKTWDNRARNAERVAEGRKAGPAFACRDKDTCGGVIWSASGVDEPRKGKPAPAPAAPANDGPPDWDAPPPDDSDMPF
jgi:hypothetical protein